MTWLPDHEIDIIKSKYWPNVKLLGKSHKQIVNKLLFHTTGGMSYPRSTYVSRSGRFSGVHPHFTIDPRRRQRWQHISLASSSYSLKRGDQDGVIQIELVGRAADTQNWPDSWLAYIAETVTAIVAAKPGIPLVAEYSFLGSDAGLLAAPYPRGVARMSPEEWDSARGLIAHQHAPYDDHWDPGAFRIDRLIELSRIQILKGSDMQVYKQTGAATGKVVVPGFGYFDTKYYAGWAEAIRNSGSSGVIESKYMDDLFTKLIPFPEPEHPTMVSNEPIDEDSIASKVATKVTAIMKDLRWRAS